MIKAPFDADFVARMEDFTEAMMTSWQTVCCRIGSDPEEEIGEEDSPRNRTFRRLCDIMLSTPAAKDVGRPDPADLSDRADGLPEPEDVRRVAGEAADEVFEIFVLNKFFHGKAWDALRDTIAEYTEHLIAERDARLDDRPSP